MAQNLESNKIFSAVLLAALVAMISGFVAKKLVHPHALEEDAVAIEGGPVVIASADKPKLPEPILHLIATADIAKGQKLSKACAACHSFDQGGSNKVGPNLYGVVNASIAAHDGFSYSDALKSKGEQWNYDNLNAFLWKPKIYASGTKMNYLGLKKPGDRAAVIAWLNTLGTNAAPPSEADIADEKARLVPELEESADELNERGSEQSIEQDMSDASLHGIEVPATDKENHTIEGDTIKPIEDNSEY